MEKELLIRLSNWLNGEQSNPFIITLHPTWKCNLRCRGCIIPTVQNKKLHEIPYSGFLKIIDEAAKLDVRRIEIHGEGEPLCKPGIIKIIQRIKKHNIRASMTTNCTLFTEEKIRDMVRMDFDIIAVSLDGPNAKIHDHLRGVKGTFNRVVKNLTIFKKYKEKMKKDKPEIILVPFLNKFNYNLLEEMIILGKKLEVKLVNFKPLMLNEKSEKLRFTKKQLEELSTYAEEAYETAKEIGMETNVETFVDKNLVKNQTDVSKMIQLKRKKNTLFSITCFRPFYQIDINPNGIIFLCHQTSENQESKENICNTTLTEFWYGAKAKSFRDAMKRGKIPEICKHCCGGYTLDDWTLKYELEQFITEIK